MIKPKRDPSKIIIILLALAFIIYMIVNYWIAIQQFIQFTLTLLFGLGILGLLWWINEKTKV
ncbi:MAG: hypothetical protein ACTSSL_11500 [Candidatus Heimdallarchaeaceae archaeon]